MNGEKPSASVERMGAHFPTASERLRGTLQGRWGFRGAPRRDTCCSYQAGLLLSWRTWRGYLWAVTLLPEPGRVPASAQQDLSASVGRT